MCLQDRFHVAIKTLCIVFCISQRKSGKAFRIGATLGTEGCTLKVECGGRSCSVAGTDGTAGAEKFEVEGGAISPRNGKCGKQTLSAWTNMLPGVRCSTTGRGVISLSLLA